MAVIQEQEATARPADTAAGVRWDLGRIFPDAEAARTALLDVVVRAAAFETEYRGRVGSLDARELAAALRTRGAIENDFMRADSYTSLRFSIDSRDVATKDLMDICFRGREDLGNHLRFFDLEWQAVPAERAKALTADPAVAADRHYLERLTAYAPHMRSEDEEKMLAARETPATSEWKKLFTENIDKIEAEFDAGNGPQPYTLDRLLALAYHPSRDLRFAAYTTAYEQLPPRLDVQAACYNAIVGDRLVDDRLRGFDSPMQQVNLRNDLSDEVVDTLVDTIQEFYPLAQRWFRQKAKFLGLPKLHLYDQYAPLGQPQPLAFEEAWNHFVEGTEEFSGDVATMLTPFLSDGRIDAEPRTAKTGGAFCSPVAWGDPPYILMNFTGESRSLETLAHEAGHALQFILIGERQSPLSAWMGLPLAEIASTFHETTIAAQALERETNPEQRRLRMAGRLETSFATIFRQTMMVMYERRAYAMKAGGQALTADRLSEIWFEENQRYYGDSIELPESYRHGWSYIPHFIATRFYTYAYAFANLASLTLYAKYREQGPEFIPGYLELLGAGGSRTPQELLAAVGIDITDPSWPVAGFRQLETLVEGLEREG